MYHRIVDHRLKHPLTASYYQLGSASTQRGSEEAPDSLPIAKQGDENRPLSSSSDQPTTETQTVFEDMGEVFELEM